MTEPAPDRPKLPPESEGKNGGPPPLSLGGGGLRYDRSDTHSG